MPPEGDGPLGSLLRPRAAGVPGVPDVAPLAEGKRSRSAVAERDIGGEAAMCPPDRCPNFIATSKRPGSYL